MTEREEQDGEGSTTAELLKRAPTPSVLGDVDDAVTPDAEGDLTPWSPAERDEEEGEA
jgi:hypothetical protein